MYSLGKQFITHLSYLFILHQEVGINTNTKVIKAQCMSKVLDGSCQVVISQ